MMTAYFKGCLDWEQIKEGALHAEGYSVFYARLKDGVTDIEFYNMAIASVRNYLFCVLTFDLPQGSYRQAFHYTTSLYV